MSKKTKEREAWRKKLEETYKKPEPINNVFGKRIATRTDLGRSSVTPVEIARLIQAGIKNLEELKPEDDE
ncbi:MAG: hypothetical protein GW754_01585 [Candidatus Pacebacteria bacterium]|nr:hypothetical protein [Candidatus Paceibacterota bacterium]NCS86903.1 hypothetical protein [Candidatus Paceibacterota bacterium]